MTVWTLGVVTLGVATAPGLTAIPVTVDNATVCVAVVWVHMNPYVAAAVSVNLAMAIVNATAVVVNHVPVMTETVVDG